MQRSGFQLDDQTGTSGAFGQAPFGTCPFGGQDSQVYTLPILHVGSDYPQQEDHRRVGEVVHRRHGLLIGARKWGEARLWRFVWEIIAQADITELKTFWQARRFRFIPDIDLSQVYHIVYWVERDFAPKTLKAGWYSFSLTIEEIV